MTERIPLDAMTSDTLDALYDQLDRLREVATRWQAVAADQPDAVLLVGVASDMILGVLDDGEQPAPDTTATQAADGPVCASYQPPATPEDSGLCARCGMYDYRHTRQAADALGIDPVDPLDQYRRIKIELEHWQTIIVPELRDERDRQQQRADRLAATLADLLTVFHPVSSHDGVRIGWTTPHPIHPDHYDQWNAALHDKEQARA